MKPLLSESQDTETLQELGRASVQIVHDLKNQLNGLKLYATFLRKRMEKSERPEDEQETIAKIIAGLERAADDTTALVRYGRPLDLRRRPLDLRQILRLAAGGNGAAASVSLTEEGETGPLNGEFDADALREAFEAITAGARKIGRGTSQPLNLEIRLRREAGADGPQALIEWRGGATNARNGGDAGAAVTEAADPFRSFAGSEALRMALAAKIVRAHGGEAAAEGSSGSLTVRLPLSGS